MRWNLRNQIMIPMAGTMLATLAAVSALNAYVSVGQARRGIQQQLQEVTKTLAESRIRLNDSILRQMHGLSAAHYVLCDENGRVLVTSLENVTPGSKLFAESVEKDAKLADRNGRMELGDVVSLGGNRYLGNTVSLPRPDRPDQIAILHVLYPREDYADALWSAASPPLIVGAGAIGLVGLLAALVASRVSRPLSRLQSQVERIARGEFRRVPLPKRNDEVRDLAQSVNRMADMLTGYEQEVRASEKLRALGQLSSGIAHQMRNAVTGCGMALDIHQRHCSWEDGRESLDVARSQLALMESHLQRLLAWGRPQFGPRKSVNLVQLVHDLLPLVKSAAEHNHVQLTCEPMPVPIPCEVDRHGIEQVLINLLLNAIEATSMGPHVGPSREKRSVRVELAADDRTVQLEVVDNGPGPASELQDSLFDPFVTGKPDGTGLGLSVARQIVEQHQGELSWRREGDETYFAVALPRHFGEVEVGNRAGS